MKLRILSLLVLFAFAICTTANAQDDNKNVSITVSGSDKTLDDAKQAALRSAIERGYGSRSFYPTAFLCLMKAGDPVNYFGISIIIKKIFYFHAIKIF